MTVNQMLYFSTLAEIRHMGRTAEKLHITQPSLSVAIAKLEEELGVQLFERSGRFLALTREGRAFLTHVKCILQEMDAAMAHMKILSREKENIIRIGCITPLLRDYFPRRMNEFLSLPENREVRFEFSIANTPVLVQQLMEGIYDMLLCSRCEEEAVEQIPILSEPLVYISSALEEGPGDWDGIAASPLIGYEKGSVMDVFLTRVAEENQVRLQFVYRAPTERAIASLVEHGLGDAVIPWSDSELSGFQLNRFPVPGTPYTREIFLTMMRGRERGGAAGRFAEFVTGKR